MSVLGGAVGGGALGGLAGDKARKDWKKMMSEARGAYRKGTEEFERGEEEYRGDPLLQGARGFFQEEMDDPVAGRDDRQAIFQSALQNLERMMGGPFGLSDPRVQEQVYNQSIESMMPALDQARETLGSSMASRGMSRSGLANAEERQLEMDAARGAGDIRRDIGIQGALQAMQDMIARQQASQGMMGQAEQMGYAPAQGAGTMAMGYQQQLQDIISGIAGTHGDWSRTRVAAGIPGNVYQGILGGASSLSSAMK